MKSVDQIALMMKLLITEAMIFGKHAVGNQGKPSGHGENSPLGIMLQ